MNVLEVEADGEDLFFLVLFDDDSVQFVEYKELMETAPYLRIDCISLLIDRCIDQAVSHDDLLLNIYSVS